MERCDRAIYLPGTAVCHDEEETSVLNRSKCDFCHSLASDDSGDSRRAESSRRLEFLAMGELSQCAADRLLGQARVSIDDLSHRHSGSKRFQNEVDGYGVPRTRGLRRTCPGQHDPSLHGINIPDSTACSIPQPRPEPPLDGFDAHGFACGVGFDLVFLEVGDHEVMAVGVREVETADSRARVHGH